MRTITLANQKGGVGKSTLCANLAVCHQGKAVIIDTDPQGTLKRWWEDRETETPALVEFQDTKQLPAVLKQLEDQGFDLCLIDTQGALAEPANDAIAVSDLVVIPTKAGKQDLDALAETLAQCRQVSKAFVFVLNEAKPNTRMGIGALQALSKNGEIAGVVGARVAIAEAFSMGKGIIEEGKSAGSREAQELYQAIMEVLNNG